MRLVYLDNAATTPPLPAAVDATSRTLADIVGNPSSVHRLGVEAAECLAEARRAIAGFAGLPDAWLSFTSGGTEANQCVLKGLRKPNKRRNHVILSAFEHPSVAAASPWLQDQGYEVELAQPDAEGMFDPEALAARVRPETELVSVIGVHNEIGVKQDIQALRERILAANATTRLHVDAVQWFAKFALPTANHMPDYLTFSGHKFNAPKGVGGLFKRPDAPLQPLLAGGGQENGLRSGTENIAGVAGMAAAVAALDVDAVHERMLSWQQRLHDAVVGHAGLQWIGPPPGPRRSPYISLFSCPTVKSEIFTHRLEAAGFAVSAGSACSHKGKRDTAFWAAAGFPEAVIDGIVRVSFGRTTTSDEVDEFIRVLAKQSV